MKRVLNKTFVKSALFGISRSLAFCGIIGAVCCSISSKTINTHNMEQKGIKFTGKLNILDSALDRFAKSHQTQINSPNIEYYPPIKFKLENREISWMDGSIAKAVLIKPHQNSQEVQPDAWDFLVLAWIKDSPTQEKPFHEFYLLKNASIDTLKSKIEDLLSQAEQKLKDIKLEDLK
jgi:hypothetical protein